MPSVVGRSPWGGPVDVESVQLIGDFIFQFGLLELGGSGFPAGTRDATRSGGGGESGWGRGGCGLSGRVDLWFQFARILTGDRDQLVWASMPLFSANAR
jgi:hypothetical protein